MKNTNAPNIFRHGEIMLMPVTEVPAGYDHYATQDYIVGHSESGHHHVLESPVDFEVISDKDRTDLYFRLFKPAQLVHQKQTDRHRTLTIPAGLYKRFHDTEYDVWTKVIRNVAD